MEGESFAVFLVLMYDILLAILVGFIAYCAISKQVIARSGWTRRDRDPSLYRKRMLILIAVAVVLGIVRLLPLFNMGDMYVSG